MGRTSSVPMHEVEVVAAGTRLAVERGGMTVPLAFLQEITVGASAMLPGWRRR